MTDVVLCEQCGEEVYAYRPGLFCSDACEDKYDRETWPEEYEDEEA